jgi:UDPglucose 6-dehydrogenase
MNISVFGMGYVGLVTAVCLAEIGHKVLGLDLNENKISGLRQGKAPIFEPQLDSFLIKNIKSESLSFSSDIKQGVRRSDVLFICLGTPSLVDGAADISEILKLVESVAEFSSCQKQLVLKSTVPIGTADRISTRLGSEFDVVSNPEFLREGFAWEDSMRPARIILGSGNVKAIEKVKSIYAPLEVKAQILVMSARSSEMTKYAANSLLAAKISLMNEMARLCEVSGADIEEVRRGVGSDPRIGADFIYAGIGYGGSCLPKDVRALISMGNDFGSPMEIMTKVNQVNQTQRQIFFRKASIKLGAMDGKKIAVWGSAFKPGVDDIREAPALEFIGESLRAGARVSVYDPMALKNTEIFIKETINEKIHLYESAISPNDALKNADALAIFTEWPCFKEPNFSEMKALMKSPIIFDGRNIFNLDVAKKFGFEYFSIGRAQGSL